MRSREFFKKDGDLTSPSFYNLRMRYGGQWNGGMGERDKESERVSGDYINDIAGGK